jgi:hypothetical protein
VLIAKWRCLLKSVLIAAVVFFIAASVAIAVVVGTVCISSIFLSRGVITVSGFKKQEWQERNSRKTIIYSPSASLCRVHYLPMIQ